MILCLCIRACYNTRVFTVVPSALSKLHALASMLNTTRVVACPNPLTSMHLLIITPRTVVTSESNPRESSGHVIVSFLHDLNFRFLSFCVVRSALCTFAEESHSNNKSWHVYVTEWNIRRLWRLFDMGFPRPHHVSGLCAWPSLLHNFKGNKSRKILIPNIFAILGNYQGPYNIDKVAEQWNNSKFRITGWNIGKILAMAAFCPKARSAAFPSKQSAKAPKVENPENNASFDTCKHWLCSHGLESRSERRVRTWFGPFPIWKPDFSPCERKAVSNQAFEMHFETRKKGRFG